MLPRPIRARPLATTPTAGRRATGGWPQKHTFSRRMRRGDPGSAAWVLHRAEAEELQKVARVLMADDGAAAFGNASIR